MQEDDYVPLRASLEAYDKAARTADEARQAMLALAGDLHAGPERADEALKDMHAQLLETVRRTELASAMARGALGVVAAMRGLSDKPATARVPYTPPEGEDYIGT